MSSIRRAAAPLALVALLTACGPQAGGNSQQNALHQAPEPVDVSMRWDGRGGSDAWTQATLEALDQHGVTMMSRVPHDIAQFCPNYAQAGPDGRRAFWAGLLSALSKHESTYNPKAKGGGGKWLGLMQIAPSTWRSYGCDGQMLNGADNMACAVKIMARQVGRDNAIFNDGTSGWQGVARDWAPMRKASKRADIAAWTSSQSYCTGNAG